YASKEHDNLLVECAGLKGQRRKPLRASAGHPVTQLWYAQQGIITPEMEFIAIREQTQNSELGTRIEDLSEDIARNDLHKQHAGSAQISDFRLPTSAFTPSVFPPFPQRIPPRSPRGFVRAKAAAPPAIIPANTNHPKLEPMIIGRNFL